MHKSKTYSQIGKEERAQIETLLKIGKNISAIADHLKRNKSTISRELKRNTPATGRTAGRYNADAADYKAKRRHFEKPKFHRFETWMKCVARKWLTVERWSPELISAKGYEIFGEFVSHEWLYQWIWKCKQSDRKADQADQGLYRYLLHGQRRRKRGNRKMPRGSIPARVMIDQRPKLINERRRIGDLEADLVLGKNHKPGLLILLDRKLRLVHLEKLITKTAAEVTKKILSIKKRSLIPIKSITFDNDSAFMLHQQIAQKLDIKTYFTRPYSSQEKGGVENRIGILRRFFPKKTDFQLISQSQVTQVEDLLNNRPMRMFKYQSPLQVFKQIALIT